MFERLDKSEWKIISHLIKDPYSKTYIREISNKLGISPSSVKKAIDNFEKLNYIKTSRLANIRIISVNMEEIIIKELKRIKNIELIKELILQIKPAINITMYGSFAKGENTPDSDIDLFIITNNKSKYPATYKGFELQIKSQTPAQWKETKQKNKAFAKEVQKGITLYGEELI